MLAGVNVDSLTTPPVRKSGTEIELGWDLEETRVRTWGDLAKREVEAHGERGSGSVRVFPKEGGGELQALRGGAAAAEAVLFSGSTRRSRPRHRSS